MTAGTVIHRTHLSLVIWFWAIYLYVNDKRGISTAQLSKTGEKEIPMFLRIHEVSNIQRKTSQEFVDAHIQNGATIECDGFKSYIGLKNVAVDAKVYGLCCWRSEMASQGAKQSESIPSRNLSWSVCEPPELFE